MSPDPIPRRRLQRLEAEIDTASQADRVDHVERLEAERETLLAEVRRAAGLGGRSRTEGDTAERARTTVAWRLRHALKKIEAVHPSLGRHLRNSVRTGSFCSYQPERPVAWRL